MSCSDTTYVMRTEVGRTSARRRRRAVVASFVAAIGAGLVVSRILPDSVPTDVAGDALYAAMIYAALVVVVPLAASPVVAVFAAAWCSAVELFQLTGVPGALAAAFPPISLVLGVGFDPRDLVVYLAACIFAAMIDAGISAGLRPRG